MDDTNPLTQPSADSSATGDQIYDAIMAGIEPELMTAELPLLDERYKGETPEQAQARAERYNKAFEEYDRQFADYKAQWNEQFNAYKRDALKSTEQEARQEELVQLQNLEQSISQAK